MPEMYEAGNYEKHWAALINDGKVSWNEIVSAYKNRNPRYHFRLSTYYYLYNDPKLFARQAEADVFGCWWRFLKANTDEYPPKARSADPEQKALFATFGELGEDFETWWVGTGSHVFSEKKPDPFISLIEPHDFKGGDPIPDSITVRIPLSMRREHIIRQLGVLLETLKPGEQSRRFSQSTARQSIFARERYHPEHYDNLLELWTERKKYPNDEWWYLAKRLRIQGNLMVLHDDPPAVASSKRRELSAKIRRMYRQADRMVWHALRGRFPCDDPIPNEPPDDDG
jgi:hypothetical protein